MLVHVFGINTHNSITIKFRTEFHKTKQYFLGKQMLIQKIIKI